MKRFVSSALLLLVPALALAHTGDGSLHDHGFVAGLAHPFTGLDHLGAMLAVGLWSALSQRGRSVLVAPLSFAALLLVGALLGMAGFTLPAVEPMVAASVLVLGLLAAARLHLNAVASGALVGAFALFHGLAHGAELQGYAALAGMVTATAALHAIGIALGLTLSPRLARVAGGGIVVLGLALVFA
ncbi:HupE/UreJ family protein [Burkholderiaceae bacterium UC74_6]